MKPSTQVLSLSQLLLLVGSTTALALPATSNPLSRRQGCGTAISPSNFWRLDESNPDGVNVLGPVTPPEGGSLFQFNVSQDATATDEQDLVASFTNVPCPPAGRGPYSLEFAFDPANLLTSSGNDRIDVYAINGPLPSGPSWNNVAPITGSQVASFSLPDDATTGSLITLNSFVCAPQMNFRFSITNDIIAAGEVSYSNFDSTETGLRIRYGC
ncbi:MAG: hypothetical protein Q9163_002874 [Psora crenata]